jgi:L-threonylcarbamoyladenylate synthase
MKTRILPASQETLLTAWETLRRGRLVAFPTDTVYGLGAWLTNSEAIDALYRVKGRDAAKAIAVLIGAPAALAQVTEQMTGIATRMAQVFWPGPLTLVVPGHPTLPRNLSPLPTVGVRMPAHPVALELLKLTGPLAVTSANLSGQPSTLSAQEVFDQLAGRIPLILDGGGLGKDNLPSTVVDCTTEQPVILRQGPISLEQILAAVR